MIGIKVARCIRRRQEGKPGSKAFTRITRIKQGVARKGITHFARSA
jgi:hypothetical protein